jgi:hypothetical protein
MVRKIVVLLVGMAPGLAACGDPGAYRRRYWWWRWSSSGRSHRRQRRDWGVNRRRDWCARWGIDRAAVAATDEQAHALS